jgi:hypothetical protein
MGKVIDILVEQRVLSLLVAVLLFLISILINLLQRRFSKTRIDRMLRKEEMVVTFLRGIHKKLGKLERNCTLELHGASSPQEVGKAIDETRNKIQSTIDGLEEHLSSFHHYRREEKSREKQKRQLQKSNQKFFWK